MSRWQKRIIRWLEGDQETSSISLLRTWLSGRAPTFRQLLLLSVVSVVLAFVPLTWIAYGLYSGVIVPNYRSLILGGLVMVAIVSARSLFDAFFLDKYRRELSRFLRAKLLARLHQMPSHLMDHLPRGGWQEMVVAHLAETESYLLGALPRDLTAVICLFALLVAGFVIEPRVGVFAALGAAVLLLLRYHLQLQLNAVAAEEAGVERRRSELFLESWEGIRTIRTSEAELFLERRFLDSQVELQTKQSILLKASYLPLLAADGTEALVGVGLFLIAILAEQANDISKLQFFFSVIFGGALLSMVRRLGIGLADLQRFLSRFREFSSFLSLEEDTPPTKTLALRTERNHRLSMRDIVFENLEDWVGPLNLNLAVGECVALTGRPGGGKSRLLEILAGLRGAHVGRLVVENHKGEPIWVSDKKNLRFPVGVVALVEQYPYLFEGTIRENLVLGNSQRLTDIQLWDVLEQVGLSQAVRSAGGLNLKLTDRGGEFTRGERYRIALCRALLLRRPFLVLDEPFAYVDEPTMKILCELFQKLQRTTGILLATRFIPEGLELSSTLDLNAHEGRTDPSAEPEMILPTHGLMPL